MSVPRVAVLMATRNGAEWLPAQLRSIAAQEGVDWRLVASDDGSADGTRAVLEGFAADHPGRVEVVEGPGRGSAANFLSLLGRADEAFVAWADQDDVWLPGKLARACAALGGGGPAAYAARTAHVAADLTPLRPSPPLAAAPDFGLALARNLLPGNTTVMNRALLRIARDALPAPSPRQHDWWLSLLATGVGARVVTDRRRSPSTAITRGRRWAGARGCGRRGGSRGATGAAGARRSAPRWTGRR
ncbi:MAG: glycosyltransferase [Hasllibacter sp.]